MDHLALLRERYGSKPLIDFNTAAEDIFACKPRMLRDQIARREITIPVIRLGTSKRAGRAFTLVSLAAYLTEREKVARREMR